MSRTRKLPNIGGDHFGCSRALPDASVVCSLRLGGARRTLRLPTTIVCRRDDDAWVTSSHVDNRSYSSSVVDATGHSLCILLCTCWLIIIMFFCGAVGGVHNSPSQHKAQWSFSLINFRNYFVTRFTNILGLCLGWNVRLIVSLPRHIAILRQEWFNGLSWNFVGMLGVTMPRMYQILVTNQLNLTN